MDNFYRISGIVYGTAISIEDTDYECQSMSVKSDDGNYYTVDMSAYTEQELADTPTKYLLEYANENKSLWNEEIE